MAGEKSLIPAERIERSILVLREHRVMLDADLADLYGVPNKALIQAVKRNRERFPSDFMFRLTKEEFDNLRSQTVTSRWGGRRDGAPAGGSPLEPLRRGGIMRETNDSMQRTAPRAANDALRWT